MHDAPPPCRPAALRARSEPAPACHDFRELDRRSGVDAIQGSRRGAQFAADPFLRRASKRPAGGCTSLARRGSRLGAHRGDQARRRPPPSREHRRPEKTACERAPVHTGLALALNPTPAALTTSSPSRTALAPPGRPSGPPLPPGAAGLHRGDRLVLLAPPVASSTTQWRSAHRAVMRRSSADRASQAQSRAQLPGRAFAQAQAAPVRSGHGRG